MIKKHGGVSKGNTWLKVQSANAKVTKSALENLVQPIGSQWDVHDEANGRLCGQKPTQSLHPEYATARPYHETSLVKPLFRISGA